MKIVKIKDLEKYLRERVTLIDVRAPTEFEQGSIPDSVNIPILDDDERHQIGICFKSKGQDAAIELGHQLVAGDNLALKQKRWLQCIEKNPRTIVTCFRGGLRSQSAQKFIAEKGIEIARLEKGYKEARNYFLAKIDESAKELNFLILSGTTGSSKTHTLNHIKATYPAIDLEGLAQHRGSAFGAWDVAQPAQADFENRLAAEFIRFSTSQLKKSILLEDESRMIGHRHIPEVLFSKMRESKVILVQVPLDIRVKNIFADYITFKLNGSSSPEKVSQILGAYKNSTLKIKTKLGGARSQEIITDLENSEKQFFENRDLEVNKRWIEKLLVWYYDPMYLGSLQKRNPEIQFQGETSEVIQYFSDFV